MRRKRDLSFGETLFHLFEARVENSARIDYLTLLRGPGTELSADRPGMKIFLGFFARSFFNFAFDPDLALHFHPIHDQSCVWIFLELPAFVAGVVGKENEAALIKIFQQHDAGGWFPVNTSG